MLSVSFHQTFIPERRFIGALLLYVASGKQGSMQDISQQTGIPMGKSSGKMPAIFDYAIGMGLIEATRTKGSNRKEPKLTPFGTLVYQEDKFLGEEITQWLAHLNLCRKDIGAKVWNLVFAQGRMIIGTRFNRRSLDDYLVGYCGKVKDRIGPLVNTYLEDAALARSGVLRDEGDWLIRKKAPLMSKYALAYSAYILSLWDDFFPGEQQVSFADFNARTFLFDICLWNEIDLENFSSMLESKGYISIDRQRRPWIMERRVKGSDIWQKVFDEMA